MIYARIEGPAIEVMVRWDAQLASMVRNLRVSVRKIWQIKIKVEIKIKFTEN